MLMHTVLCGRNNMEYFIYMTNDCNLKCEYCSVLLDCKENNLPIKPTYSNDDLIAFIKQTQMLTGDDEISIYFLAENLHWNMRISKGSLILQKKNYQIFL